MTILGCFYEKDEKTILTFEADIKEKLKPNDDVPILFKKHRSSDIFDLLRGGFFFYISQIIRKHTNCHRPRLLLHPLATRSDPLRVNFFMSFVTLPGKFWY